MNKLLVISASLALSAGAFALPVPESEANNTVATADFIASAMYPFGGVSYLGEIGAGTDATPSGIDYVSFDLNAGDYVTAAIYDLTTNDGAPTFADDNDSFLGVFNPAGALFDTDDDDGPGFLSSYHFFVPTTGRWTFAITGFGDLAGGALDGSGHSEAFRYLFVVGINPIPEPASIGLLLAGALFGLRRR